MCVPIGDRTDIPPIALADVIYMAPVTLKQASWLSLSFYLPRTRLWSAMQETGLPKEIITSVNNLYTENDLIVKIKHRTSNKFKTTKELLQEYFTSHELFKYPWKRS